MRLMLSVLFALAALAAGSPMIVSRDRPGNDLTSMSKQCVSGPVYWCKNMRNARECGATKHCIQTVWEHMHPAEDTDDICQVCKDMVAEARAQLESNETQEEIKEVFEGSCRLIPIKLVAKECIEAVDEFIPELIEFLASQMDPQVVCAVAGLCDSQRIDLLLKEFGDETKRVGVTTKMDNCQTCWNFISQRSQVLQTQSHDQVLDKFFEICGHFGSLSDGCRVIVNNNFPEIYSVVTANLSPKDTCGFTSMCPPLSSRHDMATTMEALQKNMRPLRNDETCDFCKQMVTHLRNILVSNTTEDEFLQVLKGVCGQLGKFKDQCDALTDEYYRQLYDFLVNHLDPNEICTIIGLCSMTVSKGPIWYLKPAEEATAIPQIKLLPAKKWTGDDESSTFPAIKLLPAQRFAGDDESASFPAIKLLPAQQFAGDDESASFPAIKLQPAQQLIGDDEANSIKSSKDGLVHVPLQKSSVVPKVFNPENAQLPPERMMPLPVLGMGGDEACIMCQYALHYLQNELQNPATEEQIKEAVNNLCHHLPDTIVAQCVDFVNTYGDAVIALLVQKIDPSVVCPELGLCPKKEVEEALGEEKVDKHRSANCVLCEFVMHRLEEYLEENSTKEHLKEALEKVCNYFHGVVKQDCDIFIHDYLEEIEEMLEAEFTPDEICVMLKLCKPSSKLATKAPAAESNDIPPLDPAEVQLPPERLIPKTIIVSEDSMKDASPQCVMCEFAMAELEKILGDYATKAEIEAAVKNLCHYLPKTVADSCRKFVDTYGDAIINLLELELKPSVICTELGLCYGKEYSKELTETTASGTDRCLLCTKIVGFLDTMLEDESIEEAFDEKLKEVCKLLAASDRTQCQELIDMYGPYLMGLLGEVSDKKMVCQALELCPKPAGQVNLLGGNKCTWGPDYWCKSSFHASACKATKHCREKVWKNVAPKV